MKSYKHIATLFLRLAMAATFLSAVASRLDLWGKESSGWRNFLSYTAEVNAFVPNQFIPVLAVASTIIETTLAVLLIIGYKTKWAAVGAALLTLLFSSAMAYSFGLKSPLDYSVFVDCAACCMLAAIPYYKWSVDALLQKRSV